ncbi:hypothetical protein jhhlp_005327 [Lomentospora prolificans]|uniref:FAD-binding domain-containing protein n=1 Tax=Lomentospora prolificans TaxID=41688 RepID=A0A2N3N7G7_9PEZI|nr:hypothetical protein jhhlp_005327 [Lomentospora prolificans]
MRGSLNLDVTVLIVGAGPSGATTALLLARMGVKSMVISKHRSTANTPRAHIFNQRAMEVLRDAGLEGPLKHIACPVQRKLVLIICHIGSSQFWANNHVPDMQHTSWLECLAGEEFGRIYAWGNKPGQKGDYELASPCQMSDLPQSLMEPVLVDEATKLGADFRFYTELVSFEQDPDGVTATLRDRSTEGTYTVTAKYLIGADGANSKVIEQLGIPVSGVTHSDAFNVHIKCDLSKYFSHRSGSLNWVLSSTAPEWAAVGNFRMVRPWDEFVVSMHPASKGLNPIDQPDDVILERLRQLIGDDTIDIEILSTFRWTIREQFADRYQEGRVMCIGDAVHRHPPINGLGSNTCISDAFNLSWKLAYVLKGWASPDLLDSLTIERKPVGDGVVRRANDGMLAHRRLWALIGTDPESRRKFRDNLAAATPEGARARENLRLALMATEDEVQSLGIQMNQTYLADGSATFVEPGDVAPDFGDLNTLRQVKVTTFPGYHLPHVWIAADGQSPRLSTLDITGQNRFTLLTGIGGEAWKKAAEEVSNAGGVQVAAYTIGFRGDYIDCYSDWHHVRGVHETGAVLVRPDHFIAWRCQDLVSDPTLKLAEVLGKILGKTPALGSNGA